jgi:transposase
MRGTDEASGSLFSYVDLEARIPARHPLRKIRQVVNDALASLDAEFEALYTDFGRPSIAPERLIRANLIQILFSVRSERLGPVDVHLRRMTVAAIAMKAV